MSLKIWLPLNGNLENIGPMGSKKAILISNSISNTSYDDNGKTGKGLICNGSTFWRIINVTLGSECSICYWCKPSSVSSNGMHWCLKTRLNFWKYSNSYFLNTGDSTNNPFKNNGTNVPSLADEKWHHFVITFGNNQAKLYIDGEYKGTAVTFCDPAMNNNAIKIGGGFDNAHTYDWNGLICDFRVYSHCLSLQEIKKISQGLILHYPLNNKGFGKPNIIKGTNKFSGWHYTRTSYPSVNGKVMTFAASGTAWSDANSPTIPWSDVEGKTITVSLDIRSDDFNYTSGDGFYVDIARKSTGPTATDFNTRRLEGVIFTFSKTSTATTTGGVIERRAIPTHWKRYTCTISNLSTSHFDHTYNGGGGDWFGLDIWQHCNKSVQIKNVKIEIGDSPTPWVPHVDDVEYNLCQVDNNKIADISGFNNNGTYINQNYLLHSADTIIYKTSLSFSNNTFGIIINKYLKSILNNDCTISFWIYSNDDGGRSVYFGSYNTGPTWSIEKAVNNSLRSYWNASPDQNCGANSIVTNSLGWVHICFIKTGSTNLKVYKNGELVYESTATTYNNLNFPEVFRIGRDTRGDTTSYNGLMSDFRIYCTALAQEAVIELYKNRR